MTLPRRTFLAAAALTPVALTAARAAAAGAAAGAGAGAGTEADRTVPVIGRRAWGAMKPHAGRERHVIERITLHHSGVRLTDDSLSPARVRQHQQWHMIDKGHPDIDYHYLVDRRGNIFQGRNPRFRGDTQTEYDPTGHLLICCEGDYEGGSGQRPTRAMLRSVVHLMAAAAQRYDVPVRRIRGHRDYSTQTECPGSRLESLITDGTLATRVQSAMDRSSWVVRQLPTPEGRALVRSIESS
ncbi:MAG: peptidoglycan recognition family protein [Candidatus Nanopelagicales bacterium]